MFKLGNFDFGRTMSFLTDADVSVRSERVVEFGNAARGTTSISLGNSLSFVRPDTGSNPGASF